MRKREEDLDGRLALLVAKEHDVDQAALERQLKDLEAERLEAIFWPSRHGLWPAWDGLWPARRGGGENRPPARDR